MELPKGWFSFGSTFSKGWFSFGSTFSKGCIYKKMDSFNLNNDSYTETEIEELFNLKKFYNINDIASAKTKLINQLKSTQGLGVEKQSEIMFFIDTIANRIIDKVSGGNTTQSSTPQSSTPQSSTPQSTKAKKNKLLPNINDSFLFDNKPLPHDNKLITQGTNFIIESEDSLAGKHSRFQDGRLAPDGAPVPVGYMNPINVRTISQAISFDTRFRQNYYNTTSTNFDLQLPLLLKNVVSMSVASLEIPASYYAISKSQGNSTCVIIKLPLMPITTDCWILTIPDGNYSTSWGSNGAVNILTAINNSIALAQPATIDASGYVTPISGGTLLTPEDLTFSLDNASGRSIFSNGVPLKPIPTLSNGFIIRFNVDDTGTLNMDTSIQLRFGWQLGFRSAEYVCSKSPSTIIPSCVSEGICLITGTRYVFLSIDDYQKNTGPDYIVCYSNSFLHHNIITRINIASVLGAGVYQYSNDPGLTVQTNRTRSYYGPVDIQRLHIALYDDFGRIINLNNMDWSFSLTFELLYS